MEYVSMIAASTSSFAMDVNEVRDAKRRCTRTSTVVFLVAMLSGNLNSNRPRVEEVTRNGCSVMVIRGVESVAATTLAPDVGIDIRINAPNAATLRNNARITSHAPLRKVHLASVGTQAMCKDPTQNRLLFPY